MQKTRANTTACFSFALLAVFATACGGGGGGAGGGGANDLACAGGTLPAAAVQVAYGESLGASGGTTPYAWSLEPGSTLPPGLTLSAAGGVSGTPTSAGTWVFVTGVLDSSSPAQFVTASWSITVSSTRLVAYDLHYGEAWTGETYDIAAIGAASATFSLAVNGSGGAVGQVGAATGTYTAGAATGTDVVRATYGPGVTEDLTIVVRANPTANMTGRFSTTDVWWVRFSGKRDASHPYASDWHAALVLAGLRDPASLGATGTLADDLAEACVRVEALRFLGPHFGLAADGAAQPTGLDISFPAGQPSAGHFAPADGDVEPGRANQYNIITLHAGEAEGVLGTAFLDEDSNGYQENNTTTQAAGTLGVFVDEVASFVNIGYSNRTLPGAPVGAGDVAALRAILYGLSSPGGRYTEIRRIVQGLAESVAKITAHEIGHSLGLDHTLPPQSGSLMNASAVIGPGQGVALIASDWAILEAGLPGPGRGGSPLRAAGAPEAAAGGPRGIIECGGRRLR